MNNQLKIMGKIEYARGKNVHIDSPLSLTRYTDSVNPIGPQETPYGYQIGQTLTLHTYTVVEAQQYDDRDPDLFEHLNHKAAQLFTHELFDEVRQDMFLIMRHVYEHHAMDRELGEMVNNLLNKVSP